MPYAFLCWESGAFLLVLTEGWVMENKEYSVLDCQSMKDREGQVYTPFPGADEKYDDGSDWRVYNPDKYRDPQWSPDKE